MRQVAFCFRVVQKSDEWLSKAIGAIGYLANREESDRLLGKGVRICHEELWFKDRDVRELDSKINNIVFNPEGVCFSSASKGDFTGTRFEPYSGVVGKHPDRWITITVDLPDGVEQAIFDACKSIEGKPYDYLGVLCKLLLRQGQIQDKKKFYCSEACNWAAHRGYIEWRANDKITPWLGGDRKAYGKFMRCYNEHRRWSPLANLLLMLKNNYKID